MQQTYSSLQKRRKIVLFSSVAITLIYWIVALYYQNKTAVSKDLFVFHRLFGQGDKWFDLYQYFYQFGITVFLFWVIPFIITKYFLKQDFWKFGLQLHLKKEALIICAIAYPLVIASTYFSSQNPLILSEYPLSKLIGTSWFVFVIYELTYLLYFAAYEIFFRGYLQFGLKSENAGAKEIVVIILIQTILTTLFHIGKPTPEILAAAAFGPVFGYVAFRYNSIWYGMIIHYVMNIFIDIFSLHWHHLLPQKFF